MGLIRLADNSCRLSKSLNAQTPRSQGYWLLMTSELFKELDTYSYTGRSSLHQLMLSAEMLEIKSFS